MDMVRVWEYYGKVAKEFGKSSKEEKDEEGNVIRDENGEIIFKRANYSLQFFYEDEDLERLISQSSLFKAFLGDEEVITGLAWNSRLPSEDELSQWLRESRADSDKWPNRNQIEAICHAVSRPLTFIQGPPGTGKTEMILNLLSVIRGRYPDKSVAIVSANKEAIDNITDKIERDRAFSRLKEAYAALGNRTVRREWQAQESHKVYEDYFVVYMNDKGEAEVQFDSDFLEEDCKPLFSSTIHSMRKIFVEGNTANNPHNPLTCFDYVIVDECSQVSTLLGLLAMASAKEHLILIGDNNQLPPIVDEKQLKEIEDQYSEEDVPKNYRVTAENTFLKVCEKVFCDRVKSITLTEHYRCHPAIIGFCNQYVYAPDGRELTVRTEDDGKIPIRVLWYEGEYSEYISLKNRRDGETRRSLSNMRQIEIFIKDEWPLLCQRLEADPNTSICVISPYRGQIKSLKERLTEVIRADENANEEIRRLSDEWNAEDEQLDEEQEWIRNLMSEHILTIHQSQGKGVDIVCFMSVCDYDSPTHEPWPQERRMINVAVSRAKKEFHLITCNQWLPEEFQEKECGYILAHPNPKDNYYFLKFIEYTYEKYIQMKGSSNADLTDGDFGFHRSTITSLFDRVPVRRKDGLEGSSAPEECMRDFLMETLPEGYKIYREVPLSELYSSENCDDELKAYIENGARTDFLICSRNDNALLAIEVDGELHRFGDEIEKQREWDRYKNKCFDLMMNEVIFLRIKTDGSGCWECKYKTDGNEIASEQKCILSKEDEIIAIKDYLSKAADFTEYKIFDNRNKTAISATSENEKNELLGYYMSFLKDRCLKGLRAYWTENKKLPHLDYSTPESIKLIDYSDAATEHYYFCKYGTAYAFEYAMLYEIMLRSYKGEQLDVYSFGSGGYIDAWSLAYAKARLKAYGFGDVPKVNYQGIDLVKWPVNVFFTTSVGKKARIAISAYTPKLSASGCKINMVKNSSIQEFEPQDNQGRKSNKMNRNVLVFPKILNELDDVTVDTFVEQLGKFCYNEPVYYICVSHSPSDILHGKKKGAEAVAKIVDVICEKGGYKATSDLKEILGEEQYKNCIGGFLTRFWCSDFSSVGAHGHTCYYIGRESEETGEDTEDGKKGLPIELLNSDFECEEVKDYLAWLHTKSHGANKCSQMINANIAFQIIKLEKEDNTKGKQNHHANLECDVEKRAFLERIGRHKSICWYPSAGCDFRALLYLSRPFYAKHEELSAESVVFPDLFILTDYRESDFREEYNELYPHHFDKLRKGTLKPGDKLFDDTRTRLTVKNIERFYISDFIKDIEEYKDWIDYGEISSCYGQGYYMTVKINSYNNRNKQLGTWETNVIYLYAENSTFAKNILLQHNINIDYIVRVKYGGNYGFSRGTHGKWLFYLADPLNVKYYISSADSDRQLTPGDANLLRYLKENSGIDFDEPKLTALYKRNWYYREPVTWYGVER